MKGILSGLASAVVAGLATNENYYDRLYFFFPSRIPVVNSTEYHNQGLASTIHAKGGLGRTAGEQAGYQLAALGVTLGIAIFGGALTGSIMRLPLFQQIDKEEFLFDDDPNWSTPSDFEHLVIGVARSDLANSNIKTINLVNAKLDVSSLHNAFKPELKK